MTTTQDSAAAKVSEVLQEFQAQFDLRNQGKKPPEKAVRLTDSEVNAYLQREVQSQSHLGLKSVAVKFVGPNYVSATTSIDFDKVKIDDSSFAVRSISSLLTGEKQITVEGIVTSADGMGQFKLEKAYIGSLKLPVYFIEKLINFMGPRQNPPVDISKPAPLPYGLKKVEISTGSILLRG